jgi:hypothetical protein
MSIPTIAPTLLAKFIPALTHPTYARWMVWLVGALLTPGRRTVSNLLRTARAFVPGHPSSYHRVFSHRRWSLWKVARVLSEYVLSTFVPEGPVYLAVDDTVEEHKGKKVWGKARHRDPVRSSRSYTAFRWGHKWVVLSILVKFPWARRPWALPVLVALYRPPEYTPEHGRPHRTPAVLARKRVAVLLHGFPQRKFILTGDGNFNTHDLARFAARHQKRLSLVARFFADAALYEPPPKRPAGKRGRPRVKGRKLPPPKEVVVRSPRRRLSVSWYGGGTRQVEIVTETGHWYRSGDGLVEVRWVFVHDLTGTHRDDYFFTTDPTLRPEKIIGIFTRRWSIEVTFQELRAYLGLSTTRGRKRETVLRSAPCLFMLFSVVAIGYAQLPVSYQKAFGVLWQGKKGSDLLRRDHDGTSMDLAGMDFRGGRP